MYVNELTREFPRDSWIRSTHSTISVLRYLVLSFILLAPLLCFHVDFTTMCELAAHWSRILQLFDVVLAGCFYPRLNVAPADLSGQTVIITGGNSGIGFEMARKLVSMNARVVLACRTVTKAESAKEKLAPRSEKVVCMQLDCSSLKSVDAFVHEWGNQPINILINNAGAGASHFKLNEDGYEQSYVTNVLSHAVLTLRLLPCFAKDARIIETSSSAHFGAHDQHVQPDDIDFVKRVQAHGNKLGDPLSPKSTFLLYSRSKLLQVFFVQALAKFLDQDPVYRDKHIKVNAYHPGYVNTDIWGKEENWSETKPNSSTKEKLVWYASKLGLDAEQGAVTGVWLATAPATEIGTGEYYLRQARWTPNVLCADEERVQAFWEHWTEVAGIQVPETRSRAEL